MGRLSFNATATRAVALVVVLLAEFGASALVAAGHASGAAPSRLTKNAVSAERSWDTAQLVIYKSKGVLAVYQSGDFRKEFPVVLGLQPQGRKRHANDARTPEGLYHVVGKHAHARWQYFLALDYPNETDRRAYAEEVRRKTIPDENGAPFAIGGSVGIHGNDHAAEQEAGTNWTKGCIAMRAPDIAEVERLVPVGTPVWIVE